MFEGKFLERIKNKINSKSDINDSKIKYAAADNGQLFNDLDADVHINNLLWNIPAGDVITSHRKRIGKAIVFGKKIIRKFLFWTVTKPLLQQREFNGSVTRSINGLTAIQKESNVLHKKLQIQINDLSMKLNESILEQQRLMDIITVQQKHIDTIDKNESLKESFPINYRKFEDYFRGDENSIRIQQLEVYTPFIKTKKSFLDLGCGRGELVSEVEKMGLNAFGVDNNKDLIKYGKDKGLNVEEADILDYLNSESNMKYDVITCLHVIEHLYPYQIIEIVRSAYNRLNNDGLLIFETPNPESLYNLAFGFSIDMTHKKPVHSYTMKFLLEEEGFEDVIIKHITPADESVSLKSTNENSVIDDNFKKIDKLLYGYHNYAIIGRKKG